MFQSKFMNVGKHLKIYTVLALLFSYTVIVGVLYES